MGLSEKVFIDGIGILKECYPNRAINAPIWWNLLKDVDDEPFTYAIMEIAQGRIEIFPDTNIPGKIRKLAKPKWARDLLEGEERKGIEYDGGQNSGVNDVHGAIGGEVGGEDNSGPDGLRIGEVVSRISGRLPSVGPTKQAVRDSKIRENDPPRT